MCLVLALWQPVRPGGEMCGPDGGWEVVIDDGDEDGHDVAYGLNVAEVCEEISRKAAERKARTEREALYAAPAPGQPAVQELRL